MQISTFSGRKNKEYFLLRKSYEYTKNRYSFQLKTLKSDTLGMKKIPRKNRVAHSTGGPRYSYTAIIEGYVIEGEYRMRKLTDSLDRKPDYCTLLKLNIMIR